MTLLVCALWAGEIAVLTNGFTLRVDRHERRGDSILLFTEAGQTALPVAAIAGFEPLPEEIPVETPAPAPPPPMKTPHDLVREAADRHGLPAEFVTAVARQESNFDPQAVSRKGALGLMQLMPETARSLGVNPLDPAANSDGGAKLLRELLLAYQRHPDQVRRALAAYNAGPGAVQKYQGVPPYRETQDYVDRVLRHWQASSRLKK